MKVLTPGHKYELASFEGGPPQTLQFIEKQPVEEKSEELCTVNDGTTNEQVLAVVIDRMKYLQDRVPCDKNKLVITRLHQALEALESRTQERKARGVEGTEAE